MRREWFNLMGLELVVTPTRIIIIIIIAIIIIIIIISRCYCRNI